ncbi:MAG: hypothetical protein JXA42_22585 [Anaerolineales bacterium]|nr:hypothetical protein [Anaerolineales bacterium]
MQIPIPNAFTIHQLGTAGGAIPFPFSASTRHYENGVIQFRLHPVRVVEIADLFAQYPRLVVFDVAYTSFDEQLSEQAALCEAIEFYGVDCQPVDHDAVVICGTDFPGLLSSLDHYQFQAFLPGPAAAIETIEELLTGLRPRLRDAPVLPRLPDSPFFLSSHDDCNLTLESAGPELPRLALERSLRYYAGTVLYQEIDYTGEIAGVPSNMLNALCPANSGWTIFRDQTTLTGRSLSIGVSSKPFLFTRNQTYPVDFHIEYRFDAGEWEKAE